MKDVIDYALNQGQDTGIFLCFLFMCVYIFIAITPIILTSILIVLMSCKLIKFLIKKIKRRFFILLLCMGFFVSSYSQTFHKIKERVVPVTISDELMQRINKDCFHKNKAQIIKYSLDTTAELLSFSIKNNNLGRNKHTTANCIGYAALCKAISNYAFKINGYSCRSKQVVGYLYIGNVNICKLASGLFNGKLSKFVKDHDVIEFEGKYYDPSLYDYNITLKN